MWRLWKILKWINIYLILAFATSLVAGISVNSSDREKFFNFIIDQWVFPLLIGIGALDVLLCIISGMSYRKKRFREYKEQLLSEFEFLATSEDLAPKHMGFELTMPGQQPSPGKRPHYPHHQERFFIPGEKGSEHLQSSKELSEEDLKELIKKKTSFVLLGSPTTGKSRVLFNVLKSTPGIIVMKPRTDHFPSNDALRLCVNKLTVILLDDLNEYASGSIDIATLLLRLD